jgi:hypothetical protein
MVIRRLAQWAAYIVAAGVALAGVLWARQRVRIEEKSAEARLSEADLLAAHDDQVHDRTARINVLVAEADALAAQTQVRRARAVERIERAKEIAPDDASLETLQRWADRINDASS